MSAVVQTAALLVTLLGLLSAAAVLVRGRVVRPALSVLLEFLLAAGLLRLADDPTWRPLLVAAAVVAVRRLVTSGLARSER